MTDILHGLKMESINEVLGNYDKMVETMNEFLTNVANGQLIRICLMLFIQRLLVICFDRRLIIRFTRCLGLENFGV